MISQYFSWSNLKLEITDNHDHYSCSSCSNRHVAGAGLQFESASVTRTSSTTKKCNMACVSSSSRLQCRRVQISSRLPFQLRNCRCTPKCTFSRCTSGALEPRAARFLPLVEAQRLRWISRAPRAFQYTSSELTFSWNPPQ